MLFGMREACEDQICNKCDYKRGGFRECKQKCFMDNFKAINDCCAGMCSNLPSKAKKQCLETCASPMNYGFQR